MRQLSFQEVEVVSGGQDHGTNTPLIGFTVNDALKWGAAYFGGTTAYTTVTGLPFVAAHPMTIPYVNLSATNMLVGGVGGLLGGVGGYVAGHFLGQLFNSQVAARVG